MNKLTKASLVLLVCTSLSAGAMAAEKCNHQEKRLDKLVEKLEMTDSQAEQFKQVMIDAKSSKTDMRAQRKEVKKLSDNGDLAGAADLAAKQARERVYKKAEVKQKLAEFLSTEQIEQLEAMREKKFNRRTGA